MYMNDIKLLVKNEKWLETLIQTIRIYSRDMGIGFGIDKCALFIMKSEKVINRRNWTTKPRKNQKVWRKGKLQVLGNTGSGHHQISIRKEELRLMENFSKPSYAPGISSKAQTIGELPL